MSDLMTLADRVKALTTTHNAEFLRKPQPDGTVQVVLVFANGDTLSGVGATTDAATAHLEARVAAFMAALEV